MTPALRRAAVEAARTLLRGAQADLDRALRLLPDAQGQTSMASPHLEAILQKTKAARRHLEQLEVAVQPGAERPPVIFHDRGQDRPV